MRSILVVSDKPDPFRAIQACFVSEYVVESASTKEEAVAMIGKKLYDLLFVDVALLGKAETEHNHKAMMQMFWGLSATSEIVVMSSRQDIRQAIRAVKAGASDYVTLPVEAEEVRYVVESINDYIATQAEIEFLRDQFWQSDALEVIKTKNQGMKKVFDSIRSVAPTKSTVLLSGETGTGKTLLAKLIHRHSNRREKQLITVHCGAIPDTLLESELFGHEKGSFTGAIRKKLGKFEVAHGGTIFLDEIATLTPAAQIKLLQVLQDGTFHRVGGEQTIGVDVRVISATNVDLRQMVDAGLFRKDLYYRINIFPIEVPALSQRSEDIAYLVDLFLKRLDRVGGKGIQSVDSQTMEALKRYTWPGNIRELENVVERAYVLGTAHMLTREHFPEDIVGSKTSVEAAPPDSTLSLSEIRRKAIETAESAYLRALLTESHGKVRQAATVARITPRQFSKLIGRYGIVKEEFK